jgi:hypothetical protein
MTSSSDLLAQEELVVRGRFELEATDLSPAKKASIFAQDDKRQTKMTNKKQATNFDGMHSELSRDTRAIAFFVVMFDI